MSDLKFKAEVAKKEPCKIAYIEHIGEYGKIPFDAIVPKLYAWAKTNKVMPGFQPRGIYYDSPKSVAPEKCRSEIAITFKGEAKGNGEVKTRELPEMEVAIVKFKAPASEFQAAYQKLCEWLDANGYEWAGPAMEIYTKKPAVINGETIIYANIQVPVRKK